MPHARMCVCVCVCHTQCLETGAVRYMSRDEQWLGLDIPLEAATNKEEVEAYKVRQCDGHAHIHVHTDSRGSV